MLIEFDPAIIELAHSAILPITIVVVLGMAMFHLAIKD
jgi:hypothetical protein